MKILKQETETSRIVQKGDVDGWKVCRQRKKWYGWKNTLSILIGMNHQGALA
jgi:hypothetical protein